MKHFYLIDFENVSDAGLVGFFDLTGDDTAYLFYSQKANRISIDFCKTLLEHRSAAAIYFFKVSAGNQALDLQLASFLGSLIAENPTDCDFCIISKDKGYACLSNFWLNRGGKMRLYQAGSISEALQNRQRAASNGARFVAQPESKAPVQEESKASAHAEPEAPVQEEAAPAVEEPPVPQPEEPAAASPEEPKAPAQEEPAAPAQDEPKAPAQPESRSLVQAETRALVPTLNENSSPASEPAPESAPPQRREHRRGSPKPAQQAETKAPAQADGRPAPTPPSEKTLLNAKVQQTLSKAKYDTKIIAQVASMTSKVFGDPKIKQLVYRGLIKQHGQKTGLEIYNLIKPLL